MLMKVCALGSGLLVTFLCHAAESDPASEMDIFGLDPFTVLLLFILWIVLPFALFRVNPYLLFKAAIETRRLHTRPDDADPRWDADAASDAPDPR